MSDTEFTFKHGNQFPYDGESDSEAVEPAKNASESAIRGILANLTDRRGIKQPLHDLELEARQKLFGALIELAKQQPSVQAATNILKYLRDHVPGLRHEMNTVDDDIFQEIVEDLAEMIDYATSQAYPLVISDK